MTTADQLSENSRQGFAVQKPPCIGLETELSGNLRWGCGHAYDETPVGIAVYVRNDPVNLVDPDGRFPMGGIPQIIVDAIASIATTPIYKVTSWAQADYYTQLWIMQILYQIYSDPFTMLTNSPNPGGGGPTPAPPNDRKFKETFDKLTKDIKKGLKQTCLDTLGKSNDDLIAALNSTPILDGRNSSLTISQVSGFLGPRPSERGTERAQANWDTMQSWSIGYFFDMNSGIGAVYASEASSIWLGKGFWNSGNPESILGHEFLHAVTKITDDEVLANSLGINLISGDNTSAIDSWFEGCISR